MDWLFGEAYFRVVKPSLQQAQAIKVFMTELLDVSLWKHWQIPPYCAHVVHFNPASVNCQHFCGSGSSDFLTQSHVWDVKNVYHTQHICSRSRPASRLHCPVLWTRKKFMLTDEWLIRETTVKNNFSLFFLHSTHWLSVYTQYHTLSVVWCLSSRHDICSASFAETDMQSKHQIETRTLKHVFPFMIMYRQNKQRRNLPSRKTQVKVKSQIRCFFRLFWNLKLTGQSDSRI